MLKFTQNSKYSSIQLEVYGKRIDGLLNPYSKATIIIEYPLLSLKR